MSETAGEAGSESQQEDPATLTDEELAQQFVMWVEIMIHDVESVPDDTSDQQWCDQWWQHPEAVSRFKAMHEAYQQALEDRTMSAWWIQHWDSHMRVLFSKEGPFKAVSANMRSWAEVRSTSRG